MSNVIKSRLKKLMDNDPNLFRLLSMLLVVIIAMSIVKPRLFLSINNVQSMAYQLPEFGIMAIGVMLAMIVGGIDLSVVGVANLSAIMAAKILLAMVPENNSLGLSLLGFLVAIVVAVIVGAIAGFINGFFVSKIGIPPILATLGSMELFSGIAIILTKGRPISGLPTIYSKIVAGTLFGIIPVPLIIFIGAIVAVGLILGNTTYGYKIYLVGTNEKSAKFSGLNTAWLKMRTYMYAGILSSIAGLIMLGNYNSAKASYGSAYTLLAILIAVLGGVNPDGGFGTIKGVAAAIVLLQVLSSALNMFPAVSSFYKPLVWGAFLILALLLNHYTKVRELKKIAKCNE